ncbi:Fe2+-dependent dioxygenase [Spongiibacter sp. KMU-158]|uniref:Fe2+-dependent dioxygenase n=1 Tax=Spongiibacter pelagi TaxID=2760804 RepID=A0A927GY31_9GAMM|nr:Fe2+-dependent dioxygenase [Spongiibacter pelagi]MBD2860029.1 Fe2+-dependent dioxygenase [Spongiibacter pelagi]
MLLVIDEILSADEVRDFRRALSEVPWLAGAVTAGAQAAQVKNNLQLDDSHEGARQLSEHVLMKLQRHPLFISATLPKAIYPPKFNCYENGGYYGAHVDSALLYPAGQGVLRSDISATLFLTDPESYQGGELEIETAFGLQSIKLPAGSLVLYPSSSLHQVTPVVSGQRVSSFFWLQSLVREPARREQLFELDQSIQQLTAELGTGHEVLPRLTAHYHNLLRQWSEV